MNSLTLLFSLFAITGSAPSNSAYKAIRAGGDSVGDSILTVDVIAKMTSFWKLVAANADTVKWEKIEDPNGRFPNNYFRQMEEIPVGHKTLQDVAVVTVSKAAVNHPFIAVALKDAGLTPQQFDFYSMLITSADITGNAVDDHGSYRREYLLKKMSKDDLKPTALEEKNFAFLMAHLSAWRECEDAYEAMLRRMK